VNKEKIILVYDDQLDGHHLEYINHIHNGAVENKNNKFIFALPVKFQELKNKLVWKESDNIKFHYILKDDINKRHPKHRGTSNRLHTRNSQQCSCQGISDLILHIFWRTPHPFGSYNLLIFTNIRDCIHCYRITRKEI